MMSDNPPPLPREISNDGREIWAWGHALSEWTHRQHRMRQIRADLYALPRRCGSCDDWMKSRICPREKNINGRNHGPNMNSPICGQFKLKSSTAEWMAKLQAELDELAAKQEASK